MAKTVLVTFQEIGFNTKEWHQSELGVVAIDMACQYIMDKFYPEYSECDVIHNYCNIEIDWFYDYVTIPVRFMFTPECVN